mmetsp:Transcript_35291/g.40261  ORF Transcript_35291/g.40261 Transcript_35291/m.40261 type:complete len:123 (-) Transcript_35291:230-598(-)|eukprot:CAMPEP_0194139288 /NCGR_PEP_ID=MMETSP0152-20130528/8963_1 /TAXON_ID=1049557 /ORGANISM="Thalassiothrix antarctica, Strain L6-D1" /LENGTH=122 /DNA_ID=CAMNT_0038837071 /DNA_START=222 /DNA_END=590 /DNA_ORIENTATION=+
MSSSSSHTLETIFAAMEQALPGSRFPSKVVLMTIDGTTSYYIDGKTKTVIKKTSDDEEKKADMKVKTSLEVLQKLIKKELTPQQAFMKGLLKIKGSMSLAMKLTIIVNATRKQLDKNNTAKL